MKRVLSLVMVAGVAFLLGQFLRGPVPLAGAAGGAEGCGALEGEYFACADSNGDGLVNIADPVYTLRYLFSQAPEPRCEAVQGVRLPATGQTKCYDDASPVGNEIPCDNLDFPGQDAFYQTGCPGQGRFVDNGDGTVSDNCTQLMWQKNTADVSGNGRVGETWEDGLSWRDALKYCDSLDFASHTDWRLPNVRELQSILDYGRRDPSIDPVFQATHTYYWVSSSYLGYGPSDYGYLISFHDGEATDGSKGGAHYIRAVRTIQSGE